MPVLSGTFTASAAITTVMRHEGTDADGDLMRRTAAGDREAFALLYRRHHAAVFRFARLMTGSNEAAEDVVQEVFLGLMRGAERYDPARAMLTTYLYGAARRQIRRRLHISSPHASTSIDEHRDFRLFFTLYDLHHFRTKQGEAHHSDERHTQYFDPVDVSTTPAAPPV